VTRLKLGQLVREEKAYLELQECSVGRKPPFGKGFVPEAEKSPPVLEAFTRKRLLTD
jgi:hypothetical protein